MKKSVFLSFCCFLTIPGAHNLYSATVTRNDKRWIMENPDIRVSYDQEHNVISVWDKKSNYSWVSATGRENLPFDIETVTEWAAVPKGVSIRCRHCGMHLDIHLHIPEHGAELFVEVDPRDKNSWVSHGLTYTQWGYGKGQCWIQETCFALPYLFDLDNENAFSVIPLKQGHVYRASSKSHVVADAPPETRYFTMDQDGINMPWFGISDGKDGYIAIVETPADMLMGMSREESMGEWLLRYYVYWRAQLGSCGYARQMTYCFLSGDAGYVNMAKTYRTHVATAGRFRSFPDKRNQNPGVAKALDKMKGAVLCLYPNGPYEFCKGLKERGFDNAVVHLPHWFRWRGDVEGDRISATVREVKEIKDKLGYVVGPYDRWNESTDGPDGEFEAGWPPESSMLGPLWEEGAWIVERNDGRRQQTYEWLPHCMYYATCAYAKNPPEGKMLETWIEPRLSARKRIYDFDFLFIDGMGATGLWECFSKKHRMTRTQGLEENIKALKLAASLGQLASTEYGVDYYVPYLGLSFGIQGGAGASDRIERIDERYEIPLFNLVYHDSVSDTRRYAYPINKNTRRAERQLWAEMAMLDLLYGEMPVIPDLAEDWDAMYAANADRIDRTVKAAMRFHKSTGFDEMLSHEFVSGDHRVQRSVFSSGYEVLANFLDKRYSFAGMELPAHSYVVRKGGAVIEQNTLADFFE
jgi:hypothetical protein